MKDEEADGVGLASRRAALEAIRRVDEDGAYSNLAVPEAVAGLVDQRDRAFASHLAYDTLRWRGTLDWMLGAVVDRRLEEVEPAILRVLRLGALQLLRSQVPARAAVGTAAEFAGEVVPPSRRRGAVGFVNGVLRGLARRQDALPWPDPGREPVARLALDTAHPAWIVEDLLQRFDVERTRAILEADNRPPGLTLRATGDRDALIAELEALEIAARPGAEAPEAVRAPGADPRRLAAVEEGRAVPQDEASMIVAHATGVQPGQRVLDLCSGPGGKATHLAALGGVVTAVELSSARARLVEDTAARVGVELDVRVGDGRQPPVDTRFDVVLVDAPCTGLGTGRRRPEVRWRRTPEDVHSLAVLQQALLDAAVHHVADGGHLTYSVCTWTEQETERAVAELEARHPRLHRVTTRQLLPDTDDTDGMFVVTWRTPSGT